MLVDDSHQMATVYSSTLQDDVCEFSAETVNSADRRMIADVLMLAYSRNQTPAQPIN